jgi:guanosine-3',5'-bis(diphosphate) 3'-pyrophosphohydrolase
MTELENLKLLSKSLVFAAHKHREQRRKGIDSVPYINHPLELMAVLTNEGGITDNAILCAAVLHDTIEDTETSANELVAHFGKEIANIVVEVSDNTSLEKQTRKKLQIEHAPLLSTKARAVKLADKTCNLRDMIKSPPEGWPLKRRQDYFDWGKQVIDGMRGDWPVLEAVFDAQYLNKEKADF